MKSYVVKWDFLSYWHISSGETFGATLDLTTRKDSFGLPMIPGKTIKGLFREAFHLMQDLNRVEKDDVALWFGTGDELEPDKEERAGNIGIAVFSDAKVDHSIAKSYIEEGGSVDTFYRKISSTAIDQKTGTAKTHSLRQIEVVIPCPVYSRVHIPEEARASFEKASRLIRNIGLSRRRGLGRVQVSVLKEDTNA